MNAADIRYATFALGIWISFILFGYCQESLTRHSFDGKRFEFTQALVVAQSVLNMIVSAAVIAYHRSNLAGGVPLKHWVICGLGYYGAHWFGLSSLKHIIYPLQVVIKSCKAVPVMIGEIIIAK